MPLPIPGAVTVCTYSPVSLLIISALDPTALTEPPVITIFVAFPLCPPPIPAAPLSGFPIAVIVPPDIYMLSTSLFCPLPIPAAPAWSVPPE